jgi:hypothetical protein
MPLPGGEETRVVNEPWGSFDCTLTRHGIYFIDTDTKPHTLAYFAFATHRIVRISVLDKSSEGLAVAPDGRSVLFVRNGLSESSIMLVKNFH